MYEGLPKTNFFDFIRFDTVLANVLNAILRLNELIDCHSPILDEQIEAHEESAERCAYAVGSMPRFLSMDFARLIEVFSWKQTVPKVRHQYNGAHIWRIGDAQGLEEIASHLLVDRGVFPSAFRVWAILILKSRRPVARH